MQKTKGQDRKGWIFSPLLKIVKIDIQFGCFLNRIGELITELVELTIDLDRFDHRLGSRSNYRWDRFRTAIRNEAIRSQIVAC